MSCSGRMLLRLWLPTSSVYKHMNSSCRASYDSCVSTMQRSVDGCSSCSLSTRLAQHSGQLGCRQPGSVTGCGRTCQRPSQTCRSCSSSLQTCRNQGAQEAAQQDKTPQGTHKISYSSNSSSRMEQSSSSSNSNLHVAGHGGGGRVGSQRRTTKPSLRPLLLLLLPPRQHPCQLMPGSFPMLITQQHSNHQHHQQQQHQLYQRRLGYHQY